MLQALGYTQLGDLLLITGDQLQGVCATLPPFQAAKLQALARVLAAEGGDNSAAPALPAQPACADGTADGTINRTASTLIGAESAQSQANPQFQLLPPDAFAAAKDEVTDADCAEVQRLCEGCGGISGLVALLSGQPGEAAGEQAAWALRKLASSCESRELVAGAGAIPALVGLLAVGVPAAVQEQAAGALAELTAGGEALKARVAASGAIAKAVGLLEPGVCPEGQDQAARLLCNLAAGSALCKARIAAEGGIGALVALLTPSEDPMVKLEQLKVVAALENLTAGSAELSSSQAMRSKVAAAGAIERLVALLRAEDFLSLHFRATAALRNLSAGGKALKARVAAAGAIGAVVAVLGQGDLRPQAVMVQDPAAALLLNLSAGGEELRSQIAAEGGIGALVLLLQHSFLPCVWDQASEALKNLSAGSEELRTKITAEGGIGALVAVLGRGLPWRVEHAVAALNQLCAGGEELKAQVAAAGAIAPLVALLAPGVPGRVQLQAAEALLQLSEGSQEREAMVDRCIGRKPTPQAAGCCVIC